MPKFLPPRRGATLAIAICDRCQRKVYHDDLRPDGNSPGLRVCVACWDVKDPWRLPARRPDRITLRHPRPYAAPPLDPVPPLLITEYGEPIDFPPEIEIET